MVELMREYVLSNRVLANAKGINSLLQAIYAVLEKKPKKVKRGLFKKTKKFRVVIIGIAYNENFGEIKLRIYDEDTKKLKLYDRVVIEKPIPRMKQIRENVILSQKWCGD